MVWVLSLAVGIVLADSAVVTLALPEILRRFDAEVGQVAWVLTAYNLALGLAAVPAARASVRGHRAPAVAVLGLAVFAAASAACALAGSLELLVAARAVQAIGGALAITACLELLVVATGDERRGAGRWATAGVVGAAIGPVVGGVLTQAISWQSIFIVQVPLALLVIPAALALRARGADVPLAPASPGSEPPTVVSAPTADAPTLVMEREDERAGAMPFDRPHIAANLALALLSAALTAALFLLVLLLVEGWRRTPILAAVTVTVIPLAAIAAGRVARAAGAGTRAEALAGAILVGGGLAALAFLPAANPWWTVAPQLLVGLGLGLTVESLTAVALEDRFPRALHGGWTIASRHLGVVVGLAILTPIFSSALTDAQAPAQDAIASLVIDAPIAAATKLDLANRLEAQLDDAGARVPDLAPAFGAVTPSAADQGRYAELRAAVDDQVDRAATHAFQLAFLVAGLIALLALVPAAMLGPGRDERLPVRAGAAGAAA